MFSNEFLKLRRLYNQLKDTDDAVGVETDTLESWAEEIPDYDDLIDNFKYWIKRNKKTISNLYNQFKTSAKLLIPSNRPKKHIDISDNDNVRVKTLGSIYTSNGGKYKKTYLSIAKSLRANLKKLNFKHGRVSLTYIRNPENEDTIYDFLDQAVHIPKLTHSQLDYFDHKEQNRMNKYLDQVEGSEFFIPHDSTLEEVTAQIKQYYDDKKAKSKEYKKSYLKFQLSDQSEKVKNTFNDILASPDKWTLELESQQLKDQPYNDAAISKLRSKLLSKFDALKFSDLPITDKLLIKYRSYRDGIPMWSTIPFNLDDLKNIIGNLSLSLPPDTEPAIDSVEKMGSDSKYTTESDVDNRYYVTYIKVFSPDKKEIKYTRKSGSFFPYLLKPSLNSDILRETLGKCQIFDILTDNIKGKTKVKKELKDNCLIYALKQTELFTNAELNNMRLRQLTRYQKQQDMEDLATEFNLKIFVRDIYDDLQTRQGRTTRGATRNKRKSYFGVENGQVIKLNLYHGHYFLEFRTTLSSPFIRNINIHINSNGVLDDSDICIDKNRHNSYIKSSLLVKALFKHSLFTPLSYADNSLLSTSQHKPYKSVKIEELNFTKSCVQRIAPIKKSPSASSEDVENYDLTTTTAPKNERSFWFCDFETDVSGVFHTPYMCCLKSDDGDISETFNGLTCGKQLLEYLPDNACVYFHNLAYDYRFIALYGLSGALKKGNCVMKATIKYDTKKIHLKDSLPLLSCPLSRLATMFKLENIQKEIFPYKYYTHTRLKSDIGVIAESGLLEDKKWSVDDYILFNDNIDKIPGCRLSDATYSMVKYSEFYCMQDVEILRLAINKFRESFISEFNIDIHAYLTLPSIANEVFNQRVYYPNGKLYKVGGHPHHYMRNAVYGGRCMTAYNKKWHIQQPISDFDAVSLYPSAISRLYTVEGIPEVLDLSTLDSHVNLTAIPSKLSRPSTSAFIVQIKITNVKCHYPFPLITTRTSDGLNLNSDVGITAESPVYMTVSDILLSDLVEFHKITFDIIDGYIWCGNINYDMQKVIIDIFKKRVEYKNEKMPDGSIGNPLQEVYKLLMNAVYGKTIQKAITTKTIYIEEGEKLEKVWIRHYNAITEDITICNYESNPNCPNIHAITMNKSINKHFVYILLGVHILDMSKRIMNEVMCLAYNKKCSIFYQDTDSMHILTSDIPKLEKAYKNKYDRELIGSSMGQFHSDFTPLYKNGPSPVATESFFVGKKIYYDHLESPAKDATFDALTFGDHFRGKGLTDVSIINASIYYSDIENLPLTNDKISQNFILTDNHIRNLYYYLYLGFELKFDLAIGKPSFKMMKNLTVSTNSSFIRTASSKYEIGDINTYFI